MTELRDADRHDRLGEAVDVYEVLLALLATQGLTVDDLAAAMHAKRRARGGFTQRLWLDSE